MYQCLIIVVLAFVVRSSADNASIACCPSGEFVSYKMRKCWIPTTNDTTNLRIGCEKMIRINKFILNSDGNIEIPFPNLQPKIIGPELSCVGNETNKNQTAFRRIALLCYEDEEPAIIPDIVMGYCMLVSALFLILTAVIYASFKELRDLHGKSIINLCGSLALGLGILSIMKLMEYSDMNLCATRGFLTYFFIIAAFFWTNAISIQVLRSTRKPSIVDHGWREFGWYALYAWGCPTILTIIMATINFHPGNHSKPGIGLNHCWFLDKEQQWYYMYSVMSILISLNIFIFIYTSSIVWRHSFSSGHIRALRYRLTMTIRLIIVMGLLWVFEMIGSLAEKHIVWAILDVVNALQGPLIFLVLVVFRKRVIKAMLRHGWLDCISGPVENYLAAGSDDEDNVVQHTDVPMNDH